MAILRKLARALKHFGIFEKYLNVGEHMIPYYGHHSCKCLFIVKRMGFGFKQWMFPHGRVRGKDGSSIDSEKFWFEMLKCGWP